MRNRVAFVILSTLSLFAATAAPVLAQQAPSSGAYDLSVGALYDPVFNEYSDASNVGFHFDVAKRFIKGDKMNAAGVGEVGFNHFESATLSSFMGGLRFAGNYSSKFSPFAQVLLGVEHCCGSSQFAIQSGGGIDLPWKQQFAIRVQGDWRHVNGAVDDGDGLRIGIGIVFPMNR